ncbi:P-loop containing nucleoside triphosphate hydrolase protein [Mycena vulgaris]|nr:P-loop containing nucleoside triphosphate hydrolase protein [Mycena vulgaris]
MPAVHSRVFSASSTGPQQYSFDEIRAKAITHLGYHPGLWQIKVVEAILKRDGDVVCIAATGSGKTLTFWLPLLFNPQGIQLVIIPLHILGDQNVAQLAKMGIKAIALTAETATYQNFQDIEDGKYRVIVTNVETSMQQDGGFEKLWKKPQFTSRLISLAWDESHCVSKWAGFRPEYKEVGRLRFLIPRSIPFVIVSATLPPAILSDVMRILQVLPDKLTIIRRSNDRPNINLVVREMKYSMSSFKDLAFLIPADWKPGDPLPHKFLIFFDSIPDSVEAAKLLRARLPREHRHKIKWFNSEMSTIFKETESDGLKTGKIWGLCCTDSFGMGLDLPDILLVIQWRSTYDTCFVFLVESKRFDANIAKAEARAVKRAEAVKKCKQPGDAAGQPPPKRAAVAVSGAPDVPVPQPVPAATTADEDDDPADPADVPEDFLDLHSPPHPPTISLDEYRADRRVVYDAIVAQEPAWKKQTKKKGAACYRETAALFFGNDKTVSTHIECRPDIAGGCTRCKMSASKLCCELCSPADFTNLARVDIGKPPQKPSRSRVPAFQAEAADMALRNDLHTFRKDRTIELTARTPERSKPLDLLKETHWHRVAEDGATVLSLMLRHRPIPLQAPPGPAVAINTPLRATTTSNTLAQATPAGGTPKNQKFGKCGLALAGSSRLTCSLQECAFPHSSRIWPPSCPRRAFGFCCSRAGISRFGGPSARVRGKIVYLCIMSATSSPPTLGIVRNVLDRSECLGALAAGMEGFTAVPGDVHPLRRGGMLCPALLLKEGDVTLGPRSGSSRHHFGVTEVGKEADLKREYTYQHRGAATPLPTAPVRLFLEAAGDMLTWAAANLDISESYSDGSMTDWRREDMPISTVAIPVLLPLSSSPNRTVYSTISFVLPPHY